MMLVRLRPKAALSPREETSRISGLLRRVTGVASCSRRGCRAEAGPLATLTAGRPRSRVCLESSVSGAAGGAGLAGDALRWLCTTGPDASVAENGLPVAGTAGLALIPATFLATICLRTPAVGEVKSWTVDYLTCTQLAE